jgi:hypothetical protein
VSEAEDLLAQADHLLVTGDPAARGWWPRTAAFLVRAALEEELRAFWDRTEPGTAEASMRAQLLVLATTAPPGAETARDAAATWHALRDCPVIDPPRWVMSVPEWRVRCRELRVAAGV